MKLHSDFEGIRKLLESVGYDSDNPEGEKITEAIIAVGLTLSSFNLSQEASQTVRNLLSTRGFADLGTLPVEFNEDSWQEFDYGNVGIGDYVRVKKDAYDSVTGSRHNGLVGRLTFVKSGYCSVEYIGLGTGNTMKHAMGKLQSLKRSVQ
ncbi:Hypothetical Protein OBI_RACECAR_108 [Arthrobacter phage Racecar]|nr:hypothetical protein PBI_RACECAR_190 [Arthrobacter phage Racecar]